MLCRIAWRDGCLDVKNNGTVLCIFMQPRPPGGHKEDRQLTTNFELNFSCLPTCFHVRIPKPCLSVPREKKSPWIRQYQSYISN